MAILREKCLYRVMVIGKKKFQAGYKLDRMRCLDGKTHTFPSLIGSNGLLFYPGQRKTEVRIFLPELATGGSVLGADSTNGSFSHKLCQDIPLTLLEKVGWYILHYFFTNGITRSIGIGKRVWVLLSDDISLNVWRYRRADQYVSLQPLSPWFPKGQFAGPEYPAIVYLSCLFLAGVHPVPPTCKHFSGWSGPVVRWQRGNSLPLLWRCWDSWSGSRWPHLPLWKHYPV